MTTFKLAADIPTLRLHPLFGWRKFAFDFARDSVGTLRELHEEYGSLVRVGNGKMSATFTFHPDLTRQILSNPSLFYSYSLEDIPFPFSDIEALHSLTTAVALLNGDQHKKHRRLMAPAFHNRILPVYVEQITGVLEKFIASWKTGDVVDIYEAMDLFTVYLAMEIFVGMQADLEGRKFGRLFEDVLNLLFSPATFLFPYDLPGLPYHRLKILGTELERQLKDLIRRRREIGLDGTDSLSLFLQAQDEDGSMLSDEEVIGETVAVFRGGSKTSAGALAWTLFLIAQHPDVYAQLLDELAATLRGSVPGFEQLSQLPLLEGVIKESMRLIPPVVWGIRYSMEPFEMEGYPFEKGSSVIYSSQVTHCMPEIYEHPYRFDPYRWEKIRPSPYEYFPFNAGPRRCLGAEFAMMELKIALAMLLQRFHFSILPGQRIDRIGLTGSIPKNGIMMKLEDVNAPLAYEPVRGNIHRMVRLQN